MAGSAPSSGAGASSKENYTHEGAGQANALKASHITDNARISRWSKRLIAISAAAWLYGAFQGFDKALPILFVVGLVLAIRGLRDPALGLLGVGILATIDAPARVYLLEGGLLRWNTFNYLLLIVIVLNVRFLLRLRDLQTRLLELFILLLLLQLAVTPNLMNGVQHILAIVSIFGLLVYFVRAMEANENILESVGLVNGTIAAIGGLVFYTQIQELSYINPNAFAHFPLTGFFSSVIALELRKQEQTAKGNLFHYLLMASNFTWVFLSGSRGGILIASVGAALIWLSANPLSAKGFSRGVSFLAIGSLLIFGLMSQFTDLQQKTLERFEKTFDASLTLKSRTSGRSDLAKGGIAIFKQHPLGVGTGGYSDYWTTLNSDELKLSMSTDSRFAAHSGWIKVLAENGFLGFALFVLFVASFLLTGWHQRSRGLLQIGALITLLFSIALISTEFQSKLPWFVSAGGMALLHRREMLHNLQGSLQRLPVDIFRAPYSK